MSNQKYRQKKPENTLSDALLMSCFQNFAADAVCSDFPDGGAKKKSLKQCVYLFINSFNRRHIIWYNVFMFACTCVSCLIVGSNHVFWTLCQKSKHNPYKSYKGENLYCIVYHGRKIYAIVYCGIAQYLIAQNFQNVCLLLDVYQLVPSLFFVFES